MEKTSLITNPKVTGYLNRFYSPESQELMELRIGAEEAQVPIILRETEDFLNVLLSILQPERILEIGTAVGYSAAYFAKKTGAHVITIEKSEEMFRIAEENVKKLGLEESIRLLPGDGEEEIKKLAGTATSRELDRICTPMLMPWSIPANTAMPMQTSRLSTA